MLTLLLAAWMAMPMYPLNPTAEDTLNTLNVHVSVGVTSPNRLAAPGPNVSARTELLLKHPWVVRATAEYSYATIESNLYPDGDLHGLTVGVDGLYYRGTEKMTGFIGAGVMYYHGYISTDGAAADSLYRNHGITDISMSGRFGLRAMVGLRFGHNLSLELGVSEVRPLVVTTAELDNDRIGVNSERIALHDVRLTLGYLFTLAP